MVMGRLREMNASLCNVPESVLSQCVCLSGLFGICMLQLSDPETLRLGSVRDVRKRGMNGKDSTGDRATRLLLPNMAENTAHTEGGHGLGHGVRTTDTELWTARMHPTDPAVQYFVTGTHAVQQKAYYTEI